MAEHAISQSDFARHMGVARSTVTRWHQAGQIVLDADGRVLVTASRERLASTQGPREDMRAHHAARRGRPVGGHARPLDGPGTAQDGDVAAGGGETEGDSRRAVRGVLVALDSADIKLRLDLLDARRLPREEAQREAFALGAALRGAVQQRVDSQAPRLGGATTSAVAGAQLAGAVQGLIRTWRREQLAALRRLRAAARTQA